MTVCTGRHRRLARCPLACSGLPETGDARSSVDPLFGGQAAIEDVADKGRPGPTRQGETCAKRLARLCSQGTAMTTVQAHTVQIQGWRALGSPNVGDAMRFQLTDEQRFLLECLADGPMLAVPELERHTAQLAAVNLIALAEGTEWTLTTLGEAMLEQQQRRVLH